MQRVERQTKRKHQIFTKWHSSRRPSRCGPTSLHVHGTARGGQIHQAWGLFRCFMLPQICCANNALRVQHIWHWCKNCKNHNRSQHTELPLLCHCLPPILPAKPLENMTHLYQGTFLPAHCGCCAHCSPHEHQGCAQIGAKSSWAATLKVLSSAECKVVLMECGSKRISWLYVQTYSRNQQSWFALTRDIDTM